MVRFLSIGLTALSLLSVSPVLAGQGCNCDSKCMTECGKGKTEKCPCKGCDCAKGEDCKHGKCKTVKR